MIDKVYNIFLNQKKIGTTKLESADPPMGVVFGKIDFVDVISGYNFFKDYCLKNNIAFTDYPEDKLITTNEIPNLNVLDIDKKEICGLFCYAEGMDSDAFYINVMGIPYPFYEEEFPHHVKAYNDMLKTQ